MTEPGGGKKGHDTVSLVVFFVVFGLWPLISALRQGIRWDAFVYGATVIAMLPFVAIVPILVFIRFPDFDLRKGLFRQVLVFLLGIFISVAFLAIACAGALHLIDALWISLGFDPDSYSVSSRSRRALIPELFAGGMFLGVPLLCGLVWLFFWIAVRLEAKRDASRALRRKPSRRGG